MRACVCVCILNIISILVIITCQYCYHGNMFSGSLCVGDAIRYWKDNIIVVSNYCLPFGQFDLLFVYHITLSW